MIAPDPRHPDASELRAFSLGRVADDRIATIADHLAVCPSCCELLDRDVSPDPLLDRIRAAVDRDDDTGLDQDLDLDETNRRRSAVRALRRVRFRTPSPEGTTSHGTGMPARVGDYDLIAEVGRGGMGVVYQARDRRLHRLAAVKMVLEGRLASPDQHLRFRLEAELAARVQHPNIVQVYDVGRHDGLPFLVMEWIASGSLADRLDGHTWPAMPAAKLVETLARALQVLHDRGVIHRDLKPANVLLAEEDATATDPSGDLAGEASGPVLIPKIADFGTARLSRGDAGLTRTGLVLGTPQYMAPEQARGATAMIGPASDVYALGAILYEMLAGAPPFTGDDPVALLDAVATRDPAPLRRNRASVHRDLDAICLRCLEKEPHRRYPSAIALADDLARFRTGQPITIRPIGAATKITRWCRRRPALMAVVGAAAACLLIASPLVTWKWIEAEGLRRRGLRDLYLANVRLASQAWDRGQVQPMKTLLDAAARGELGDHDLRRFEWFHLRHLARPRARVLGRHDGWVSDVAIAADGSRVVSAGHDGRVRIWDTARDAPSIRMDGHDGPVNSVACSPDGAMIVSGGQDGTVRFWDARTGTPLREIAHGPIVWGVAISPDGTRVASAGEDRAVRIWDAATGRELHVLRGHSAQVIAVAFSPDGRRVLSGAWDRTARIWNLDAKDAHEEPLVLRGHTHFVTSLAFHPDGTRVATAGWDQTVRIWDAATGSEQRVLRGHTGLVASVAFNRDGDRLASTSEDGTARLWDPASGVVLAVLKGHGRQVVGVAFHPNGRELVTGSRDHAVRLWNLWDLGDLPALRGHLDAVASVAYAPDGALISGSHDGTVRVWDPRRGKARRVLRGHVGHVLAVASDPTGSRIASSGADGTVRLWDAATGAYQRTLDGHKGGVLGVSFRPDGARVASCGEDRSVKIWDARTGALLQDIPAHSSAVTAVAFHPDGSRIASASCDQTAKVWDAETGAHQLTLKGHFNWVTGVVFHPDGTRLATSGHDGTIRTWDATTASPLHVMHGHTSQTWGVAFSPDGARIASAGYDRTIRLWDADNGHELMSLDGHGDWVNGVAFRPDGKALASAGADHSVRIAETEAVPEAEARGRAVREQAFDLVETTHANQLQGGDLRDAIRRRTSFSIALQEAALAQAETYRPDLDMRSTVCWEVVRVPGATAEAAKRACREIEEICRRDPQNPYYAGTHGSALVREGHFREALDVLAIAESLHKAQGNAAHPCDVAFVVIAESRLGRRDRAREQLARLHTLAADPRYRQDRDVITCVAEADAVVAAIPEPSPPMNTSSSPPETLR